MFHFFLYSLIRFHFLLHVFASKLPITSHNHWTRNCKSVTELGWNLKSKGLPVFQIVIMVCLWGKWKGAWSKAFSEFWKILRCREPGLKYGALLWLIYSLIGLLIIPSSFFKTINGNQKTARMAGGYLNVGYLKVPLKSLVALFHTPFQMHTSNCYLRIPRLKSI